jgi:hypothetical protein
VRVIAFVSKPLLMVSLLSKANESKKILAGEVFLSFTLTINTILSLNLLT